MMKRLLCLCLVFVMLASALPVFATASYKVPYSVVISNPQLKEVLAAVKKDDSGLIYPPDSHPRVFLNEDYIKYLVENKDSDVYRDNFNYLLDLAKRELPALPEDGYLNSAINNQLIVRALMFALGQVPKSHARETVEYTLKYLADPKTSATYSIDVYKALGSGMQTGALVYDWCYSVMTAAQRSQLAEIVRDEMYRKEQPCRPDNVKSGWSDIAGKSVGQPLIYNSISAIAIYDEYPDVYEAIMPKIQGTMADIMREFGQAGALNDGSIAYSREYYSYYVALLFDRMGYPNFYGDQSKVGYKMLYARLPYGALMKQGDDFSQTNYKMGAYTNSTAVNQDLAFLSVMENDPYLRFQYKKENPSLRGWEALLLTEADVGTKLPDDLPLAYYISEPKSEILARTSWQDGLDSPAVSALMSIHNRRTGDHDHGNIGDFQLYYKGPLTMPGGMYQGTGDGGWGGEHWRNYYTRTISSNCMTVYDPNEKVAWHNKVAEANDGGQRMVTPKANDGTIVISDYDEQMSDDNIWATTEAHYIGPNEKTPAFSYIKGDITNAYSANKMQNYKRGMVFMDTFNPTYPGVMVVYDRVAATSDKFEKRWLLQSVTKPEVSGNKITIVNTEDGANGKLVNTTLFPGEVDIETVGEVGKFIVEGKEYPTSSSASDVYKGGIRLEVSPKKEEKTDIFLNAMYVTDANGNAPELPMIKEETGQFVGVTTLDRMVMFSKSGERVNEEFNLTVRNNGYGEMLCFITDIEQGKWCIDGKNGKTVINADKDGYSLTFNAKPGTYKIYPIDGEEAEDLIFPEMPKEKIGDFAVKMGSNYSYIKYPNKLVDGVPYLAIADFMERYLGAKTEQNGDTLTITRKDGAVVTLKAGQKEYDFKMSTISRKGTMEEGAPFMDNGVMYVTLKKGLAGNLGFGSAGWTDHTRVLRLMAADSSNKKPLEGVDESRVIWPQTIMTSSGEFPGENMIDRDLNTRWSSDPADGEWAIFDLGEPMDMTEVLIAWYNGDKRNWKFDIQVSNDNVNYTDVIKGGRSAGQTTGVESFKLPEGTKARYVRIVGHGEEVTKTFYCSVTEFIIMK